MTAVPMAEKTEIVALSRPPRTPTQDTIRALSRTRSAVLGVGVLFILVAIAIAAPILAPYPPDKQLFNEPGRIREPPCIHLLGCPASQPQHLMGLDGNRRDMLSRVMYGARVSLFIGFTTVGFAIVIGTFLGSLAAYAGGWVDNVIMRCMDVLLAFPGFLLAISIVTVLGPGLTNALLAIGIVEIPAFARVARASVLSIKEQEFVTASRMIGAVPSRILFRGILPLAITPLIVQGTLGIATAILDAAGLSFLGLGAQPPTAEWGSMVGAERNQIFTAPHLILFPGLMIMITVLAFNLLGDGLRDALDPRLRKV